MRRALLPVVLVLVLLVAVAVVVKVVVLRPSGYTASAAVGPSGEHETVLAPHGTVKGLVVFMHGFGATDAQITDPSFAGIREALTAAGLEIVATDAHGDNFGSAVSVADQQALVKDVQATLPAPVPVDVLAFSMGGLDALESVGAQALPGVRAVAMLSAACDVAPYLTTPYRSAIEAAYPGPSATLASRVATTSPTRFASSTFAHVLIHFWASPQDTTVPLATETQPCLTRLSRPAASSLTLISGQHGDLDDVSPADVLGLFQSAAP